MPVMLASYEDTSKHIEERPIALGPDLSIQTFDAKGRFRINGEDTVPENISVDYVCLSSNINASGNRQSVLETLPRRVGVSYFWITPSACAVVSRCLWSSIPRTSRIYKSMMILP